jgi:hypothetical protein
MIGMKEVRVNAAGAQIVAQARKEGRAIGQADGKRYAEKAIEIAGPDKAFKILTKDLAEGARKRDRGGIFEQAFLLTKHAVDSFEL